MSSSIQQRPGKGSSESESASSSSTIFESTGGGKSTSSTGVSVFKIGRTVTLLVSTLCLLSWFVTSQGFSSYNETITYYQNLLTQNESQPRELYLTDAQLRSHDGSDPLKPVYVAINGSVYNVEAGRKFYGPEGAYSFFSGPENTRAFVTRCFEEPATHDIRGAEEMFLPTSTPEIDALYTSGELKSKKEQERRQAKKKMQEALDHWVGFFNTSQKYHYVGKVKRDMAAAAKAPIPPLCQNALDGRPVREPPLRG